MSDDSIDKIFGKAIDYNNKKNQIQSQIQSLKIIQALIIQALKIILKKYMIMQIVMQIVMQIHVINKKMKIE